MQLIRSMVAERSARPPGEQVRLWVERHLFLKRRWEGVAEDGTAFAFDLAARLKDGGVIWQTGDADYVIAQRLEPVLQVAVSSVARAALAGWKLGNLHFPVEIGEGFVRVTADPAVREMLDREGWAYEEVSVVFQPLKVPPHATGEGPADVMANA